MITVCSYIHLQTFEYPKCIYIDICIHRPNNTPPLKELTKSNMKHQEGRNQLGARSGRPELDEITPEQSSSK